MQATTRRPRKRHVSAPDALQAALRWHPDKNPEADSGAFCHKPRMSAAQRLQAKALAEANFKRIAAAYKVFADLKD